MQPELHRNGYAVFIRCYELSSETAADEFASVIDILDGIIGKEDFFPSPSGAAVYRDGIEGALAAAQALASGLTKCGISAAIGIAWGDFRRIANVQDWNTAALPLNQAARLAYCDSAKGHVLVTPHVRETIGTRLDFSVRRACMVKGAEYFYHAIESPDYRQVVSASRNPTAATAEIRETSVVLWDIVKYSAKHSDDQADLAQSLALMTTTVLHTFNARLEEFSPTGDGGFALFSSGLKAIAFAQRLGKYASSRGIVIRIGIGRGQVAFAKRGPVGPAVLRADEISGKALPNGIAILADVWNALDRISQADWQPAEIEPGILRLESNLIADAILPKPASQMSFTAADRNVLLYALSDIPQFGSVDERRTFARLVLSEGASGAEVYRSLRFLNWSGAPLVVADNLIRMLEAQDVAPGIPALRVLTEAVEPLAGVEHRERLVGLRRRLGWV